MDRRPYFETARVAAIQHLVTGQPDQRSAVFAPKPKFRSIIKPFGRITVQAFADTQQSSDRIGVIVASINIWQCFGLSLSTFDASTAAAGVPATHDRIERPA